VKYFLQQTQIPLQQQHTQIPLQQHTQIPLQQTQIPLQQQHTLITLQQQQTQIPLTINTQRSLFTTTTTAANRSLFIAARQAAEAAVVAVAAAAAAQAEKDRVAAERAWWKNWVWRTYISHPIPANFSFKSELTTRQLHEYWHFGDKTTGIRPYRELNGKNFTNTMDAKKNQKLFSRPKGLMQALDDFIPRTYLRMNASDRDEAYQIAFNDMCIYYGVQIPQGCSKKRTKAVDMSFSSLYENYLVKNMTAIKKAKKEHDQEKKEHDQENHCQFASITKAMMIICDDYL